MPAYFQGLFASLIILGSLVAAAPVEKRCNETQGVKQIVHFGERPAYSPDGRKLAFMGKSYGDAFEYDLETGNIRLLTQYNHAGYLRVQYMPNGDLFLIGSREYVNRTYSREVAQEMWILKPNGQEAFALNHSIFEGVAISTKTNKIAWSNNHEQFPDEIDEGETVIYTANIDYPDGVPTLTNKTEVVRESLPCMLEPQDFFNNDQELTYNCYLIANAGTEDQAINGTQIRGINLQTNETTIYRARPEGEFNEVEGIFPNSPYTLVESNYMQPNTGAINDRIEIWKMRLEPNTTDFTRLTWFTPSDPVPGFKANNPVVSPDGRTMALQQARARTEAGLGYGIFLIDLEVAAQHY